MTQEPFDNGSGSPTPTRGPASLDPLGSRPRRIKIAVASAVLALFAGATVSMSVLAANDEAPAPTAPKDGAMLLAQATPSAMSTASSGSRRGDLVMKGDAACTRCHDESESYPVLSIAKTKHGTRADIRTPTCTSCHGTSDAHANKPAELSVRPAPDTAFGKASTTKPEVKNAACLTCHEGKTRMFWQDGAHAARDVGCTSCHQVHTGHDKVRDKVAQSKVCFECHKEQRVQISKPSRHPVTEGRVACSDCHNPHGSAGPKMMVRNTINDTCYQCHAEKRGPFIWNHQPVTENCAHCHNPHGTTTASMLKWRAPFLCQQCHDASSHRGNFPNLTTTSGTSGNTIARGCVNCHTNIHGGNNPSNASDARTLRR